MNLFKPSSLFLFLSFVIAAHGQTTYSTLPEWDGSYSVADWNAPNTTTYGETFIAPSADTEMKDFTFYIASYTGSYTAFYTADVYQWNGSAAVGPAVYVSSDLESTFTTTFTPVTVDPDVNLIAGDKYVAFFTISDPTNYANTLNANASGYTKWGYTNSSITAGSGGGTWVYENNGDDPNALTSPQWARAGSTLAWKADFSSPAPSPAAAIPMGLGLLCLVRRRRKK